MAPTESADKVIHATLRIGETTILCRFRVDFDGAGRSRYRSFVRSTRAGGKVRMPLAKTFFFPCFGISPAALPDLNGPCRDRMATAICIPTKKPLTETAVSALMESGSSTSDGRSGRFDFFRRRR